MNGPYGPFAFLHGAYAILQDYKRGQLLGICRRTTLNRSRMGGVPPSVKQFFCSLEWPVEPEYACRFVKNATAHAALRCTCTVGHSVVMLVRLVSAATQVQPRQQPAGLPVGQQGRGHGILRAAWHRALLGCCTHAEGRLNPKHKRRQTQSKHARVTAQP